MHSPSLIKSRNTPKIWEVLVTTMGPTFWSFLLFILTISTIIYVDLSDLASHYSWEGIKQTFLPSSYFQPSWFADLLCILLEHLHCSAADEPNSLGNQVEPINNSVQEHLHGCQFHPHIMPIHIIRRTHQHIAIRRCGSSALKCLPTIPRGFRGFHFLSDVADAVGDPWYGWWWVDLLWGSSGIGAWRTITFVDW